MNLCGTWLVDAVPVNVKYYFSDFATPGLSLPVPEFVLL
jgi:hypothetical protein